MRRVLTGLLVLAFTLPVSAQWGYKKQTTELTIAGTAVALFTASEIRAQDGHGQATQATCSLTGANIRYTSDGTTPTTSLGTVLTPGVYVITGTDILLAAQGIRDDSTSATWNCSLVGNGP